MGSGAVLAATLPLSRLGLSNLGVSVHPCNWGCIELTEIWTTELLFNEEPKCQERHEKPRNFTQSKSDKRHRNRCILLWPKVRYLCMDRSRRRGVNLSPDPS